MKKKCLPILISTLLCLIISKSYSQQGAFFYEDPITTVLRMSYDTTNNAQIERNTQELLKKHFREGHRQVRVPRFAFTDKNNRAVFSVGGYVELVTAYDFDRVIGSNDFVTYNVPMVSNSQNNQRLLMDISNTTIFFNSIFYTKKLGDIVAHVEGDFRGPASTFQLQEAYVKIGGFTVGQTNSLMTDSRATFNTIDHEGPSGYTYLDNLVVQYKHDFGTGFSAAIGLEYPVISATYGKYVADIAQRIPDVPLWVQYAWNKNQSYIRLTGLLRNMEYYDLVYEDVHDELGWGGQFSTNIKISRDLYFYGNAVYGAGISRYVQDISGVGLDMITSSKYTGELRASRTSGLVAGLQYNIADEVPFTIGYSSVRQYENDYTFTDSDYKFAQYCVANLFYNLRPGVQFGVEGLYGTRENFDGATGQSYRVQAMVRVNF